VNEALPGWRASFAHQWSPKERAFAAALPYNQSLFEAGDHYSLITTVLPPHVK
jgi:hypothetical protein